MLTGIRSNGKIGSMGSGVITVMDTVMVRLIVRLEIWFAGNVGTRTCGEII